MRAEKQKKMNNNDYTEIELETFPDDETNYIKVFTVSKRWLFAYLKSEEGKDYTDDGLKIFLKKYELEDAWGIYCQAKIEGELLREIEENR